MAKTDTKPMTKTALIKHLSEECDLQKKKVAEVLDELLNVAYTEAKKEHGFKFPGLGKLVLVDRAERPGRNPRTGEPIMIPAKKSLKFYIAKAAKDAVVGPKK